MRELLVEDGSIVCRGETAREIWTVPVRDVALVAEYTTDQGPAVDDYFVVFLSREQRKGYFAKCTMRARGVMDVLAELGRRFGEPMELELFGSTVWASRVVWPVELRGRAYLQSEEIVPTGMWERVLRRVFGPSVNYRLADQIRQFLETGVRES